MSNALLKLHQRENCFIICLGEIFNKSLYFFVEVMAFASKVAKLSIPEEHLVCPVCLTVPRSSPVRQCNRGHIVCPDCYAKLEEEEEVADDAVAQKRCPTCRELMRDDTFSIVGKYLSDIFYQISSIVKRYNNCRILD